MDLPTVSLYKDLHGEMQSMVPPIALGRIVTFYDTCGKKWEEKYETMYKERYCRFIRVAESNGTIYARGSVWAEIKKTVCYDVDIALSASGVIMETQCECGVGQGPSAHCKHVGTFLIRLAIFKDSGMLSTEQTCTQLMQKFHQSRPHRGSSVRARNFMSYRKMASKQLIYDPRPSQVASP